MAAGMGLFTHLLYTFGSEAPEAPSAYRLRVNVTDDYRLRPSITDDYHLRNVPTDDYRLRPPDNG